MARKKLEEAQKDTKVGQYNLYGLWLFRISVQLCAHTSACRLQHCTAPPEAALQRWCQRVSTRQVGLGNTATAGISVSITHTHAHLDMLVFSHACTQCSPHHKLMSHYSVISVLFAPPRLSELCHTAGTHKLNTFPFQRARTDAFVHICNSVSDLLSVCAV